MRRLFRNSIGFKLGVGLSISLFFFVVAAGISLWQNGFIEKSFRETLQPEQVAKDAALQMGANTLNTELAVLDFLSTNDSNIKPKISSAQATFNQFEDLYRQNINGPEELALADLLSESYREYNELGLQLVDLNNQQGALLDKTLMNIQSLLAVFERLLNDASKDSIDNLANSEKALRLTELKTSLLQGGVLLTVSQVPRYRWLELGLGSDLEAQALEFEVLLARYTDLDLTVEERQQASVLASLIQASGEDMNRVTALSKEMDTALAAFQTKRSYLNAILDREVHVTAQNNLLNANESVSGIMSSVNNLMTVLLVVGLGAGIVCAFLLTRNITGPLKALTNAADRVKFGDLSARVEVTSEDEIGKLASSFNEMIAERHQVEYSLKFNESEMERLAFEATETAAIGRIISSSMDVREVYVVFAEHVRNLVPFDWMAISTLDEVGDLIRIDFSYGTPIPAFETDRSFKVSETMSAPVVENGVIHQVRLDDADELAMSSPLYEVLHDAGIKTVLMVPLIAQDQTMGTLNFCSNESNAYPASLMVTAQNVGDQIAGAISNAWTSASRREAENEVRRARDELEERVIERTSELADARDSALAATKAKSQFLANMSHELRTPLNAVIGYSELLQIQTQGKVAGSSGIISDLDKIKWAGQHLLGLVDDILDLSRVESGKMELYEEEFNIYELVHDVLDLTEPLAQKSSNSLTVTCSEDIGVMHSDQLKVRQALSNLLSNACKFTENGEVSLVVETETIEDVRSFRFTITDTGIGISQDVIDKLFQPFTQADSSTSKEYGGSGLGLNLSRRFCRMMGGDITVDSNVGQGSTFVITLPERMEKDIMAAFY